MKNGDLLKVANRSRQGGLCITKGPQYSSDTTTNGQSESLYESHNHGSLTQRSGFPEIRVHKYTKKLIPAKQINKLVRAGLQQKPLKEEHEGSEDNCVVDAKISVMAKIYQPKKDSMRSKHRVCHCYACEYKRMIQLKEGNLPLVHHFHEKRRPSKPEIVKPKIITFTETPAVPRYPENCSLASPMKNIPSAPPEKVGNLEGVSSVHKSSTSDIMAKLKPFVNEDKKENNYRKRLRFKLTKKKIWIHKQNKRYKPYQLGIIKIKKNSELRRCSSLETFVYQRYLSKEIPALILIDLFKPKIAEAPEPLQVPEEPHQEPVMEATEATKEDLEVSAVQEIKKKELKKKKTLRFNNIKKRLDEAKLETLLFYEPDPIKIHTII